MKFSCSVLLIGALCVSSVLCQSYMTQPNSNQIAASQEAPCGGTINFPEPIVQVEAGEYSNVVWTALPNGQQSQQTVYLFLLNNDTQIVRSVDNVTHSQLSKEVRIMPNVEPGQYFLQWRWTTYYSCARINVVASTVSLQVIQAGVVSQNTLKSDTYDYYELHAIQTQLNDKFLLVEATGPSGLTTPNSFFTVVASEDFRYYPTLTYFQQRGSTLEHGAVKFGMCRDNNGENEFLFGVIGSPASVGQAYTLRVTAYEPVINSGQLVNGEVHNGNRYYKTAAYSSNVPRRVVLRSSQTFEEVPQFQLARNCDMTNTLIRGVQTSATDSCILLDNQVGDKYIEVPAQTNTYILLVEEGDCEEITDAASPLTISIAMIFGILALLV